MHADPCHEHLRVVAVGEEQLELVGEYRHKLDLKKGMMPNALLDSSLTAAFFQNHNEVVASQKKITLEVV